MQMQTVNIMTTDLYFQMGYIGCGEKSWLKGGGGSQDDHFWELILCHEA